MKFQRDAVGKQAVEGAEQMPREVAGWEGQEQPGL
jgi:hypothetical protein